MAELSKQTKIVLCITGCASAVYVVLMLIIPEIYFGASEFHDFNPITTRQVGTAMLAILISVVIGLKRNDFEQYKSAWEIGIIWLIGLSAVNISASLIPGPPAPITAQVSGWINNILGLVVLILNIYCYMIESKNR